MGTDLDLESRRAIVTGRRFSEQLPQEAKRMIPFFYFNVALVGMAALWCFTHLPGHGFHILMSSNFLTSVVLLATGVGLIRRHPLALSSLLGLAGLLCCIPVSFLTSGFTANSVRAGAGFMSHFLPKAIPSIITGFADDLVFNLVLSTIALITFRMIRSVKFSNYFGVEKASWPRAFASMGVLLVLFMLNYTTAEKTAQAAGAKGGGPLDSLSTLQSMMSSTDIQEALASGDMTVITQKLMEKQANGTADEKKALSDLQKQLGIKGVSTAIAEQATGAEAGTVSESKVSAQVLGCKFALDESHLAIELSNQDLAVVDLRTRQLSHRQLAVGEKILGPDLDFYFDLGSHSFHRISDPVFKYELPVSQRFLTFTPTSFQVLVYDTPATGVRRIEIPSGRVIWNVVHRLKVNADAAFTSLDLNWAYLQNADGQPVLCNIVTGRLIVADLSFRHIRSVEFGATSQGLANWVRFSGQSDDGRIRLGLVDLASGRTEELPIPDSALALFDSDRRLYVTSQSPIQLKRYSIAADGGLNVSTQDLGLKSPLLFTSLLSGGRFVALGVQDEKQMMVIDLERSALLKVGSLHEAPFMRGSTCFAASPSRQLFTVAAGASAQIFWVSELASPSPRSLTVPLAR